MILSSAPEFIPWTFPTSNVKTFTERKYSDTGSQENIENIENKSTLKTSEAPLVVDVETSQNENNVEYFSSNRVDEIDEIQAEEILDPNLTPRYTPIEYKENGELEYLRGYNSCKENEGLEFSDRLERLSVLIDTLKTEYVDLNEFYDPIRELVVKAIESIMQVEMVESKSSISKIVSTILEEMEIEADGEIRLFLNPNDAVLLKNVKFSSESTVKMLSDHRLTRGSVRAVMGDSIIESMKENRVNHIVNQILGENKKKATKPLRKKITSANSVEPSKN
jgi:flagellar biosynthesis/type III secretory pathway protein FliH